MANKRIDLFRIKFAAEIMNVNEKPQVFFIEGGIFNKDPAAVRQKKERNKIPSAWCHYPASKMDVRREIGTQSSISEAAKRKLIDIGLVNRVSVEF